LIDEADVIAKKTNYPTPYMAADERARLLIAAGRSGEADMALDAFHPPPTVPGTLELDSLRVQVSRAENAFARGDAENASRLAAQVLEELSNSAARDYLKWLEARAALVQGWAILQLGRPSDALPLLERAVELRQSTLDSTSPVLALVRIALANCYLDLGESDKAKALSDAAAKAIATHHEVGNQYLKPLKDLQARLRRSSSSRRAG